MQSRGSSYSIGFTTGLSLVCAIVLTGVSMGLADRQERNRKIDKVSNILAVLRIDPGADASAKEIEEVYEAKVGKSEKDGIVVYTYKGDTSGAPAQAYATMVDGMGLWGPVKGVLALKPDLRTIRGVRFYDHEETPGLGGRISEKEFTGQFEGKSVLSDDGQPGIAIVSAARKNNEVDAITGATLTCKAVQKFVNQDLKVFLRVMRVMRGSDQ